MSGSQHTMKSNRVASSRWVLLTLRLSLSNRLHRTPRVIGEIDDLKKIDKPEFKSQVLCPNLDKPKVKQVSRPPMPSSGNV